VKIAKHNAHGMQLLVELKPLEALALAVKLIESAQKAGRIGGTTNFYFSTPCAFEDDNDRWVETDFDVVVQGFDVDANSDDVAPTYPCGKDYEAYGKTQVCNMQKGHEPDPCFRR
jgi:hypothetical protein